jgi:hypothetical protein
MEGKITGTGKRIMTMMLSVIMVTGIFAGMKLEVRAAKNYSIDLSDPGSFMFALQNTYYSDDTLVFTGFSQPPAGDKYIYIVRWDYIYNSKRVGSSITTCGENLSNVSITIPNDSQYDYAKLVDYTPPTVSQGPIQVVEFVFYIYYPFTPSQPTVTPPSQPTAAHSTESSAAPSHECSFQWVTTVEPQPGIDGLEEYKCMSCGMVKESQPIPASMATVKNLYGFIKDAPENGNVTIDFGKLHTISDYLLNKMSERSDVTVTISFEYQSAQYEITFPSGTDYSAVLEDEDTMYGYFGVAARLGLTVEAK